ncbi:MAG: site-2 protease family protein [Candidatus Wildermuthbacteria bacterium]|nr:site-2 protease family protein [Candidatus Wildermuthbacteria bacterium]
MDFLFFQIIILLFSIVLHEVSHGWVANSLGDPTAKNAGRLTLNPLPHIDPVGSIALPLFLVVMSSITGGGIIFGWAKPVPVNPANLRDQKWGSAMVSLAGPASNLAVAVIFSLLLRFLGGDVLSPSLTVLFGYIAYINILLAVFNLLPIPPLDGSHILFSLLPASFNSVKIFLGQYGFLVLLFFVFFSFQVISLVVNAIFRLLVGSSFF